MCTYEYIKQINKYITYTDFSGSKLPDDKTLSNRTLVLLSSEIFNDVIIIKFEIRNNNM